MSVYEYGPRRRELINKLRSKLHMTNTDIDDISLLSMTQDTWLLARIELGMAFIAFKDDLFAAMLKWIKPFMRKKL